jgi:nucleoside phosphorylase
MKIIKLFAPIAKQVPLITNNEAEDAIAPASSDGSPITIDLTEIFSGSSDDRWDRSCQYIQECLDPQSLSKCTDSLAVFGFAPIPILMAFGRILGDKRSARIFERHRHSDSWLWESNGQELGWRINRPSIKRNSEHVVILLSVSGSVSTTEIPDTLSNSTPVYEITVARPLPNIVRTEQQLQEFLDKWRELLNEIHEFYGSGVQIHLLPATPLSISIECGRRLLPKVDPTIHIYDKSGDRFNYAITIGERGAWREMNENTIGKCELLILVALTEEFEELHHLFPEMKAIPDAEHGGSDFIFSVQCENYQINAVACLVGAMGISEAQLTADRALTKWKPKAIINIGIAASLHQDLKLGDVLIADQVDGYDSNLKAVSSEEGSWDLQHRGTVFHGDHSLLQYVKQFKFTHRNLYDSWRSSSRDIQHELIPQNDVIALKHRQVLGDLSSLDIGHLASGSIVGAASGFANFLKGRDGTFRALEMEAGGMARAAVKRTQPISWLVIRGISDLGDERKAQFDSTGDGGLRKLAMRNATNLMLTLIKGGLLSQINNRQQ